jgi:hypothetical protein
MHSLGATVLETGNEKKRLIGELCTLALVSCYASGVQRVGVIGDEREATPGGDEHLAQFTERELAIRVRTMNV